MSNFSINKNIVNAAKWSTITEISVKLVTPLINVILARVLAPEAFGVVATATMIVSFADMFTDAGFQKYLIQHEFKDEDEKYRNANVAFWTNLIISLLICSSIFLSRDFIARTVGNPGLGHVIFIASLQLILTSFSSIQMALFRRAFDFKTLFLVRIISAFIPIVITLPLAYFGFGYWSIIIGNLLRQFSDATILSIKSKWKPRIYYEFKILVEMFSFSMWSLIEAFSIWLTTWVDSLIIGQSMSQYYLGLYKNSTTMVNSIFTIITGATTPVLFTSLSRLQEDNDEFNRIFLKFQRLVSLLVFPLGIGIYLYRDLATRLLLGEQWLQASDVIGIWALTSSVMIVLGNYCSELYRSKGRPKLSFIAQVIHLLFLVPACLISMKYGFWALVYTRSLMRLQFILVHLVIMKFVIKFPIKQIFINIFPAAFSSIIMLVFGNYIVENNSGPIRNIVGIVSCMVLYLIVLILFKSIRLDLKVLYKRRVT